jgi:hypothetical protein
MLDELDMPPEEPPPHAARIVAAASPIDAAAIKTLLFIAVVPSGDTKKNYRPTHRCEQCALSRSSVNPFEGALIQIEKD